MNSSDIPCGRPAAGLCLGGRECWCKYPPAAAPAALQEPKPLLAGEIAALAHRMCTHYRHVAEVEYGFTEMHLLDFAGAIEREVVARHAAASLVGGAPIKDRAAIESSCRFIEEKIAPRKCDSDGVSGCLRCQSVYLAKRMREMLAEGGE